MLGDEELTRRSNCWWRVRQVAEEILASPVEDRDRILLSSCGNDEELLAEVRLLLEAAEHCNQKSLLQGGKQETTTFESNAPGDRIGPYRLLRKIGTGGFGAVWVADQMEPVKRRVAIKLINPWMDRSRVLARFKAERPTLAMIDHPNIARVFDLKSTDDGRLYFVMELVNGIPITEYCNTFMLGLEARVQLMRVVSSAVQHAHQKGVIHCGLKPGNVLVGDHNERPVVKVLDFGVARALEVQHADKAMFSECRQFFCTPEYMSPEQVDLSQIDVDTRSDVYSLGVMLYELLVGTPPFESRSLRSLGIDEIRRVIQDVEPTSPSERIGRLQAPNGTVPFDGTMSTSRARKLIRGELDWIVRRAMAKLPDRRYPSANDFNEDLGRYLKGVPVESAPSNQRHRLSRLVRWNRTGVGITTAMLILFLGSILFLLSENSRARAGALKAEAAHAQAIERVQEAKHEGEIAMTVIKFLNEDMLGSVASSLEEGHDHDISMQEVLDAASKRIEGVFKDDSEAEASIHMTIARSYRVLGLHRKADLHFDRSNELWKGLLGAGAVATISALEEKSSQAAHEGRMELSRSLLLEAIDLRTKLDGPDHPETLAARRNLMYLLKFEGRYGEAEELLGEIYSPLRRVLGIENQRTLDVMIDLAEMMQMQGRHAEAASIVCEVVAVSRRINGLDDDRTLLAVNMLAVLYKTDGRLDEASELLTAVLREAKAPQHSHAMPEIIDSRIKKLVAIQVNLGDVYRLQGRNKKATELLDEVLDIQRSNFGPKHPRTIKALELCAQIRLSSSRYQEAEPFLEEAIAASRETFGDRHVQTAFLCTLWSETLLANCRVVEAVEQATFGLEVVTRVQGDGHPRSQRAIRAAHDAYLLLGEGDPTSRWVRETDALHSRFRPVDYLALDPPLDESSP